MKYAVILGDGMADWKIPALGGKTCLESARTPVTDALAPKAELGRFRTVPEGFKPGSDVANMSVLGFDPAKYYTGRSPLEAVAMGISLNETDVTLRANLVTLSGGGSFEQLTMADYSAGEISTEEARELIEYLKKELDGDGFTLYPGISYRHCLVVKDGATGHDLTPPHDISDKKIAAYLPKGKNGATYLAMMRRSYELLKDHPVNRRRIAEGKNPANSLWLWGEGTKPALAGFTQKTGLKGGVISAVDLVKGMALLAGMKFIPVEGATGNYDTNFRGKALAAADALTGGGLDYVYIHMEAPDECGHHGDIERKIYSIEQIDGVVIKALKEELERAGEEYCLLICPDHPTPCAIKTHVSDPVPYMIYTNTRDLGNGARRYTEDEAERTGIFIENGYTLIDRLLEIK